jgi:hypothetical protein
MNDTSKGAKMSFNTNLTQEIAAFQIVRSTFTNTHASFRSFKPASSRFEENFPKNILIIEDSTCLAELSPNKVNQQKQSNINKLPIFGKSMP